jgi:predicted small secreted protein
MRIRVDREDLSFPEMRTRLFTVAVTAASLAVAACAAASPTGGAVIDEAGA